MGLFREILLATVAALGFAVLFNAPRRVVLLCAVTGGVAFAIRQLLLQAGTTHNLATLISALVVGLVGELAARRYRVPALVFKVTGFVPLIPGALSYRTVAEVLNGNYVEGLATGLQTALLAAAIAGGVGTATAIFRLRIGNTR